MMLWEVVCCCEQERSSSTNAMHVEFLDAEEIQEIIDVLHKVWHVSARFDSGMAISRSVDAHESEFCELPHTYDTVPTPDGFRDSHET
jgi:hypothetical protein